MKFFSMTQGEKKSLEKWNDRFMELVQRAFALSPRGSAAGAGSPAFCNGLSGHRAGKKLIESTPFTADETE